MNYSKRYINFINGRYVGEGIRITAGILLPSFLMNYFGELNIGFVMSLGALCVSAADTPGASKHRFNGMFACSVLVTVLSIGVHYTSISTFLLGLVIVLSGFVFSMFHVYGNRSAAVGIAALLVMVMSLQTPQEGKGIWINAGYILAGGIWYMLYSLVLYRLRPYKFIQQVLSDYIFEVSVFLKLRGDLYADVPEYEKINEQLLQQQIDIEAQQNMLSDLLFNTRTIVKESTHIGRVLVKTYLEVTELYESVMTTYQQYHLMHEQFDNTGILEKYQQIIYLLSAEMEEISMAIKSDIPSEPNNETQQLVQKTRKQFEELRQHYMNDDNVENFVSLGRIQNNLEDMADKISQLHLFTTYEVSFKKEDSHSRAFSGLAATEDFRPSLFFNNLHFESNIFRHSVRVALALLVGYIVSLFFKVDHGYWILLTIVVILKPAYALSKRRNSDRLIGTALGIVIGLLVLFFIKNTTVLLVIMIIFMAGSYMFIRTNYFLTVLLMTPYIIIFFHYLYPANVSQIMLERIIDTAIGSVIAFFASLFLIPAWERNSIKAYMLKMLEANDHYYSSIAFYFCSDIPVKSDKIKIARREVLISLANLSDAFTRMISEPKRHQQGIKNVHRFVAINHTLISHLSSLSYLLQTELNTFRSPDLLPVIDNTRQHFKNAMLNLLNQKEAVQKPDSFALKSVNEKVQILLEKRKLEIAEGKLETKTKKELVETKSVTDQFNFIYSNASVICKISNDYDAEMGV